MLRPRERRRPLMPNRCRVMIEQKIVAFAAGIPGSGRGGSRRSLPRPQWGGLIVSAQRGLQDAGPPRPDHEGQAAVVDRQLPRPVRTAARAQLEPHIETTRPGELVGIDCVYVGRLRGGRGPVWQITAIDTYSSFAWADLVICPDGAPGVEQTSKLARRVPRELKAAGWKLERVLTDNRPEFGRHQFDALLPAGAAHTQTRSGCPQTNGHVERCTTRSSE